MTSSTHTPVGRRARGRARAERAVGGAGQEHGVPRREEEALDVQLAPAPREVNPRSVRARSAVQRPGRRRAACLAVYSVSSRMRVHGT